MKKLLKKLNLHIEHKKIVDITLFDNHYINTFDTHYIIRHYDNTNIKYKITEKKKQKEEDKSEEEKIKKQIDVIRDTIKKSGTILQTLRSYKNDFSDIEVKRTMDYIKREYNINRIPCVYMYTSKMSSQKKFGILENKIIPVQVNKIIEESQEFYMIYFSIDLHIYEKKISTIAKYIIDTINLLKQSGTMIIRMMYAPFNQISSSLYLLFINCFSKVTFIYSKWENTLGNSTYIILSNKISNIDYNNETHNIEITIEETEEINKIKTSMMEYMDEIFKFMDYSFKLTNCLYNISKTDISLYGKLKNKILEKFVDFNRTI